MRLLQVDGVHVVDTASTHGVRAGEPSECTDRRWEEVVLGQEVARPSVGTPCI